MIDENEINLCQLKQDEDGYFLDHTDGSEDDERRLWLVARALKKDDARQDYKIQKFDVIKLGRIRFRVKDFKCDHVHMSMEELYQQELKEAMEVDGVKDVQDTEEDQIKCRICWDNSDTDENPLILACKCKGSGGLIHFDCLKTWILS